MARIIICLNMTYGLHLPDEAIVSDTGELQWINIPDNGRFTVDTDRYEAVVGRRGHFKTTHMDVDLFTPYASLQLISLDWDFISQTNNLLLVVVGRVANSRMVWFDEHTRNSLGDQWGSAPTRIEPVSGIIQLHGIVGAHSL